jgi:hypothetical protein
VQGRRVSPFWHDRHFSAASSFQIGVSRGRSIDMIKLTQERELTPYVWVHPDEER